MAHAYSTIADGGTLESGSLASQQCAGGARGVTQPNAPVPGSDGCPGPVGIWFVAQGSGKDEKVTKNTPDPVPTFFSSELDDQEISMMKGVLTGNGTAADAAIPGVAAWGKTGTTSNYTDAWFVGSTPVIHTPHGDIPSMTAAVWVGYPNRESRSMAHDYGGKPVYGGTYPALIWRNYMMAAIQTREAEDEGKYLTPTRPSSKNGSTGSAGAATTGGNSAQTGTTSGAGTIANGGTAASSTTQNTNSAITGTTGTGGVATGGSTGQSSTTTPPTNTPPPGTSPGGGVTAPSGGALAPGG
jgi:penicillin-binding protein 1A